MHLIRHDCFCYSILFAVVGFIIIVVWFYLTVTVICYGIILSLNHVIFLNALTFNHLLILFCRVHLSVTRFVILICWYCYYWKGQYYPLQQISCNYPVTVVVFHFVRLSPQYSIVSNVHFVILNWRFLSPIPSLYSPTILLLSIILLINCLFIKEIQIFSRLNLFRYICIDCSVNIVSIKRFDFHTHLLSLSVPMGFYWLFSQSVEQLILQTLLNNFSFCYDVFQTDWSFMVMVKVHILKVQ